MYTYILKSHDLYKIGKAINVEKRIKEFSTGNPSIELIKTIDGNCESYLHRKYKDKRVVGEWFQLTVEDIDEISNSSYELKAVVTRDQDNSRDKNVLQVKKILAAAMSIQLLSVDDYLKFTRSGCTAIELYYNDELFASHDAKYGKMMIVKVKEPITQQEIDELYEDKEDVYSYEEPR